MRVYTYDVCIYIYIHVQIIYTKKHMDLYLFDWFEFGLDIIGCFCLMWLLCISWSTFCGRFGPRCACTASVQDCCGKAVSSSIQRQQDGHVAAQMLGIMNCSGNAEHHDMFWATQNHDFFSDQQIFRWSPRFDGCTKSCFFRGRSFRSSTSLNLSEPDDGDMAATRGKLWLA